MTVPNALAYYDTATITAIISFIVQTPEKIKHIALDSLQKQTNITTIYKEYNNRIFYESYKCEQSPNELSV